MTRPKQKEDERCFVQYYLEVFRISGTIVDGNEAPDFVVDIATGKRIGVEVIEYEAYPSASGLARCSDKRDVG